MSTPLVRGHHDDGRWIVVGSDLFEDEESRAGRQHHVEYHAVGASFLESCHRFVSIRRERHLGALRHEREPGRLEDVRVVVDDEEYVTLGCNILAVAPSVVVMAEGNDATAKALRDHGVDVHTYAASEINKGEGGPTCLTRPILRG